MRRKLEDWEKKIQGEIRAGEKLLLPFAKTSWFKQSDCATHWPTVAKTDGGLIAYTKSPGCGAAGIRTKTRLGRYLMRLKKRGVINKRQFNYWYNKSNRLLAKPYSIAKTRDEIAWVYENGPSSCMGKHRVMFDLEIHPTEAYAAGDIGVAYELKSPFRVRARCLVREETKSYWGTYGDTSNLEYMLQLDGYTRNRKGFLGSKLLYLPLGEARDGLQKVILPYLDIPNRLELSSCGKYLIIVKAGGDIIANAAGGVYYHRPHKECYICGEKYIRGHRCDPIMPDSEPDIGI